MHLSLFTSRHVRVTVPAVLTLASMFCGYLSVTFTVKGAFVTAAWLIVASGVLDALDGPLARALHAANHFGGELDSFADLVSFGVAPSFLLYRAFFTHWGIAGLAIGFMPIMATALRLTRYNLTTDGEDHDYFRGFTSTANGCLLASFLLFSHGLPGYIPIQGVGAGLVVVSCALMVSGIPYMSIGKFTAGGVWRTPQGALWMPVWLTVVLFPAKAFFPAMLTLMLQGPLGPRIEQALHHVHGIHR
ncbi:MAG: CDP-diacylglycerol--serine O-phosphatidyltransferase [Chloroflexota bacterium]